MNGLGISYCRDQSSTLRSDKRRASHTERPNMTRHRKISRDADLTAPKASFAILTGDFSAVCVFWGLDLFCIVHPSLSFSVCPAWNTTSGSRRSVSWTSSITRQTPTCPTTWTSACSGTPSSGKYQSQRWRAKSCARPCSSGCPGKSSMSRPPYTTVWRTIAISLCDKWPADAFADDFDYPRPPLYCQTALNYEVCSNLHTFVLNTWCSGLFLHSKQTKSATMQKWHNGVSVLAG